MFVFSNADTSFDVIEGSQNAEHSSCKSASNYPPSTLNKSSQQHSARMMASRVLSRFLPGGESAVYGHRQDGGPPERRLEAGRPTQEHDRFQDDFDDHELGNMLLDNPAQSVDQLEASPVTQTGTHVGQSRDVQTQDKVICKQKQSLSPESDMPRNDDEVPESLLMEDENLLDRESQ